MSTNTNSMKIIKTQEEIRMIIKIVGAIANGIYEKYLSLSAMVGKSNYNTFKCIKEKVWQKINNQKNNFLFQASKDILIKDVIQAIPIFSMSDFKLSRNLSKKISALMTRFRWSHKHKDKRIQQKSWCKMEEPKVIGGLGFRGIESFNKATLAK